MKNVKRALAMCLTLALLLSCSPVFNVSATGTETVSEYNTIMHDFKPTADENDMTDSTYAGIGNNTENVIRVNNSSQLDFVGFKGTPQPYVNLKHPKTALQGNYIFEAEICVKETGQTVRFYARNNSKNNEIITLINQKLSFTKCTCGGVKIDLGVWYKITYIFLDAKNFEALVQKDGEIVSKHSGTFADTMAANFEKANSYIRLSLDKYIAGCSPEFAVRNVKWYIPDSNSECTDANDDHVCDYDIGCVPVSECEDADNDGYCDHTGCGKRTVYNVTKDNQVLEITASGVLDLNGKDATVTVTGATTKLSVVDTSWMTNKDLSDKKAGKLTVDPEGTGTVESYTQYGDFKYLKVENKNENGEPDGTYSFHPFNLGFTRIGLNTIGKDGIPAVCIQVTFVANDVVRDLLRAEGNDYGIKKAGSTEATDYAWLMTGDNADYKFTADTNRVRAYFDLGGSLLDDNFEKTVSYQAVMKIGDMEIVSNQVLDVNPREVMTQLNAAETIVPTDAQKARIQALWNNSTKYSKLQEVLTKFN